MKPGPVARPAVRRRAAPGIERPLVDRHEQHARIRVEDVVRPVAVVHVPVEDQDALEPVGVDRVACGDRDVVEQAEAHRPARLGVMPGRPVQRCGDRRRAREQHVDDPGGAPGAVQRGLVRVAADDRVRVDRPAARGAGGGDPGAVTGRVDGVDERRAPRPPSRGPRSRASLASPAPARSPSMRAMRSGCGPVSWRSEDSWRRISGRTEGYGTPAWAPPNGSTWTSRWWAPAPRVSRPP